MATAGRRQSRSRSPTARVRATPTFVDKIGRPISGPRHSRYVSLRDTVLIVEAWRPDRIPRPYPAREHSGLVVFRSIALRTSKNTAVPPCSPNPSESTASRYRNLNALSALPGTRIP